MIGRFIIKISSQVSPILYINSLKRIETILQINCLSIIQILLVLIVPEYDEKTGHRIFLFKIKFL